MTNVVSGMKTTKDRAIVARVESRYRSGIVNLLDLFCRITCANSWTNCRN